jgi:hypothetical protein
MLDEALSYPRDDDDPLMAFLIGSGIVLVSFIIGVTIIPLYGYLLQVFDDGRTGAPGLPEFEDWETIIVDGLKFFVLNLLYTGIPGFVLGTVVAVTFFFIAIGGFAVGADGTSGGGAFVLVVLLVGGLVALVALVLVIAGSLLLPAAVGRMRVEDEFSAALDVRAVFDVARNGDYLVAVVLAWIVGFVFTLVGGLLSIVLIGLPVLVYGFMVTFHLYGQAYARAVGTAGATAG